MVFFDWSALKMTKCQPLKKFSELVIQKRLRKKRILRVDFLQHHKEEKAHLPSEAGTRHENTSSLGRVETHALKKIRSSMKIPEDG